MGTLTYDKEAWRSSVDNGQIPRDKLEEIFPTQFDPDLGGPALMHPEAARAMSTLLQQAHEDGITELAVKFSYRTYTKQLEKWDDYKNHQGNLAATPGTSNHGWAVSVDFIGLTGRALTWLSRNARRYGFVNDVASENWHYTYQEGLWNGDEMTEQQQETLKTNDQFRRGIVAYDNAIDKGVANPKPPADKSAAWLDGFRFARRAYTRPKATK